LIATKITKYNPHKKETITTNKTMCSQEKKELVKQQFSSTISSTLSV
jgi:hypothetical protein